MRAAVAGLSALLVAAVAAEPPVTRHTADGLELLLLTTAAPVADVARSPDANGGASLAVLTLGPGGEKDQSGELLLLTPGEEGVRKLDRELPAGLTSLGELGDTLLLGLPGRIHRVRRDGTVDPLAEARGLDLLSVEGGRRDDAGPVVARAGRLTRYRLTDGRLEAAWTATLPVSAERTTFGLRIGSPPVVRLAASAGAGAVAVAGPVETGTRRLRSQVVDLETGAAHEAWALLPAEERLVGSSFARLGDRPVMFVQTIEQIGLLVDQQVRVFTLPADRTRRGVPPILAFDTECPLWGTVRHDLADLDGDGTSDLATVYTRGVTLGTLTVEVRRGRPGGGFEGKPLRSTIDVEALDWRLADDWTGDGHPDLVVVTASELRIYPGTPEGRRPVASRPSVTFPTIPAGWDTSERERTLVLGRDGGSLDPRHAHLIALDLDGDGRSELIALAPGKDHQTALALLRRLPDARPR